MLLRTYDQCLKAVKKENIIVATDDERISMFCELNSIAHIETSSNCLTGTDRVAEVAEKIVAKRYINVQADEPVIDPLDIKKVLNDPTCIQILFIVVSLKLIVKVSIIVYLVPK